MADFVFLALTVAFFAAAVAYVKGCDRIIGPDPLANETAETDVALIAGEVRS